MNGGSLIQWIYPKGLFYYMGIQLAMCILRLCGSWREKQVCVHVGKAKDIILVQALLISASFLSMHTKEGSLTNSGNSLLTFRACMVGFYVNVHEYPLANLNFL